MLTTPHGEKNIADVKQGDLVMTEGHEFTPVLENAFFPGEHKKVTIHFREPEASITVTDNHWMLVSTKDGHMVPMAASKLAVGLKVLRDAPAASANIAAVQEISSFGKWGLTTGSCSVFANGIIAGTACGNTSSPIYTWTMMMERYRLGMSDDTAEVLSQQMKSMTAAI